MSANLVYTRAGQPPKPKGTDMTAATTTTHELFIHAVREPYGRPISTSTTAGSRVAG